MESGERVKLSKRLTAVAAMVTKGNTVCDVGCDHGFVPVYLVLNGISPHVIAMDVNGGPLAAARGHVAKYRLSDYIETRLSDGLSALQAGEADTLICAGMGGRLVVKILEEGREKLAGTFGINGIHGEANVSTNGIGIKEMILQPQSDLQYVRNYLRQTGYAVADEDMVAEDGKYYPMMRVCAGDSLPPDGRLDGHAADGLKNGIQHELEDKYGPVLLRRKHPVLREYLVRETGICMQILENLDKNGNGQENRRQEIMKRLQDVETALSCFPAM